MVLDTGIGKEINKRTVVHYIHTVHCSGICIWFSEQRTALEIEFTSVQC